MAPPGAGHQAEEIVSWSRFGNLALARPVPDDAAWVFIEKVDGKFNVSAQASGSTSPVVFAKPGFDSAEKAIKASVAWADLLAVQVLYVRGVRDDEGGPITGDQVKAARNLLGWSRDDLAAYVGLMPISIADFETNKRPC